MAIDQRKRMRIYWQLLVVLLLTHTSIALFKWLEAGAGPEPVVTEQKHDVYVTYQKFLQQYTDRNPLGFDRSHLEYLAEQATYEAIMASAFEQGWIDNYRDLLGYIFAPNLSFIASDIMSIDSWWDTGRGMQRLNMAFRSQPVEDRLGIFLELADEVKVRTPNNLKAMEIITGIISDEGHETVRMHQMLDKVGFILMLLMLLLMVPALGLPNRMRRLLEFRAPSDHVLLTTARGIASEYAALGVLTNSLPPSDHIVVSANKERAAHGLPNSKEEIAQMASEVIREYELGWFKRNRFLGMIEGSLRAMGVSHQDARYLKGLVEIYWHKKNYISKRKSSSDVGPTSPESASLSTPPNATFADLADLDADEFLDKMFSKDNPAIAEGRKLADQCLENGIRKNETVVLSTIRKSIFAHFPATAGAVENGFLERMLEFVNTGEIVAVRGGQNDLIWMRQGNNIPPKSESNNSVSRDSWKENLTKNAIAKFPFLPSMYQQVEKGMFALRDFQSTLTQPSGERADRMLSAFLLGVVEARVRLNADPKLLDDEKGVTLILIVAGFARVQGGFIGDDSQLGDMEKYYLNVMSDESLGWFRKAGMFWAASTGESAGATWREFEDKVLVALSSE